MGKKPLNPEIMRQRLEFEYKKKINDIKKLTEDRDFIVAKVAFTATVLIFINDKHNVSKFNLADKYNDIYLLIKDVDTVEDMISKINNEYKSSINISDLEFFYPKDFMTYSSI